MAVPDPAEVALAISLLTPLADPSTHEFGVQVRAVTARFATPFETLQAVADDTILVDRIRFAAFYGIMVRLWRERKFREYAQFAESYESSFGDEPMYNVFRAQAQQSLGMTPFTLSLRLTTPKTQCTTCHDFLASYIYSVSWWRQSKNVRSRLTAPNSTTRRRL